MHQRLLDNTNTKCIFVLEGAKRTAAAKLVKLFGQITQ